MEETLDLNHHMMKKRREKLLATMKKVGMALDGHGVDDVLFIMSAITKDVLDTQDPERRLSNCNLFKRIIEMTDDPVSIIKNSGVPSIKLDA
jgi:hypothetical protein